MDQPHHTIPIFSDSLIVLVSLLCALICVVGLMAACRCSSRLCGRRRSSTSLPVFKGGLKKNAIDSLPKFTYKAKFTVALDSEAQLPALEEAADCAICLSEFADGDEIRVLPHCNHVFHVVCVDKWLRYHSTCPSCRQTLTGGGFQSRCGDRCTDAAEPDFLP